MSKEDKEDLLLLFIGFVIIAYIIITKNKEI
jgi:hypothetical protein